MADSWLAGAGADELHPTNRLLQTSSGLYTLVMDGSRALKAVVILRASELTVLAVGK